MHPHSTQSTILNQQKARYARGNNPVEDMSGEVVELLLPEQYAGAAASLLFAPLVRSSRCVSSKSIWCTWFEGLTMTFFVNDVTVIQRHRARTIAVGSDHCCFLSWRKCCLRFDLVDKVALP